MSFGAIVNLIALLVFVALWPVWPWAHSLSPRPAILAGVIFTFVVLLWVTQLI